MRRDEAALTGLLAPPRARRRRGGRLRRFLRLRHRQRYQPRRLLRAELPAACIEHVFVNGRPIWSEGKQTGISPRRSSRNFRSRKPEPRPATRPLAQCFYRRAGLKRVGHGAAREMAMCRPPRDKSISRWAIGVMVASSPNKPRRDKSIAGVASFTPLYVSDKIEGGSYG